MLLASRSVGRKKLRGGKRYYRRLRERGANFVLKLEPEQWYDLWHEHFDREGYTRRREGVRRAHLEALFTAFKRILAQTASTDRAVQVFLSIAPSQEAEQDALYVHTPNPNGTRWGVTPPPLLRSFIEGQKWEVGAISGESRDWWIVQPR
jgi:hypothetical protein